MKKLYLIILLAAGLVVSACTITPNSSPSTYSDSADSSQIPEEVISTSPSVTDDQMADDLNNDLDFNLDQEFSKLESELE